MTDTTTGGPVENASVTAARLAQEQRARVIAENLARKQAQAEQAEAKKQAQAQAAEQARQANEAKKAQQQAQKAASGGTKTAAAYSSVKSGPAMDLPEQPPVIEEVAARLETPVDVSGAPPTMLYITLAGIAALLIFGKGFKNGR